MSLKIKSVSTSSISPPKNELHKHFESIVRLQKCERGVKNPKGIEKTIKHKTFHKTNKNIFSYSVLRCSLVCDQAISLWSWNKPPNQRSLCMNLQALSESEVFIFCQLSPWIQHILHQFCCRINLCSAGIKHLRSPLFFWNNPKISILDWPSE